MYSRGAGAATGAELALQRTGPGRRRTMRVSRPSMRHARLGGNARRRALHAGSGRLRRAAIG